MAALTLVTRGSRSCQNSASFLCPAGRQIDDAMKDHKFTIIISVVAALYWVLESLIHLLIFLDPYFTAFLPTDGNELWMRSGMVVLMIFFGLYADIQTGKLLAKEREKQGVFVATVSSTQHILNNLLNQMQIALLSSDGVSSMGDETKSLFDQALREGKEQVIRLSSITEIDEATIRRSVQD